MAKVMISTVIDCLYVIIIDLIRESTEQRCVLLPLEAAIWLSLWLMQIIYAFLVVGTCNSCHSCNWLLRRGWYNEFENQPSWGNHVINRIN